MKSAIISLLCVLGYFLLLILVHLAVPNRVTLTVDNIDIKYELKCNKNCVCRETNSTILCNSINEKKINKDCYDPEDCLNLITCDNGENCCGYRCIDSTCNICRKKIEHQECSISCLLVPNRTVHYTGNSLDVTYQYTREIIDNSVSIKLNDQVEGLYVLNNRTFRFENLDTDIVAYVAVFGISYGLSVAFLGKIYHVSNLIPDFNFMLAVIFKFIVVCFISGIWSPYPVIAKIGVVILAFLFLGISIGLIIWYYLYDRIKQMTFHSTSSMRSHIPVPTVENDNKSV